MDLSRCYIASYGILDSYGTRIIFHSGYENQLSETHVYPLRSQHKILEQTYMYHECTRVSLCIDAYFTPNFSNATGIKLSVIIARRNILSLIMLRAIARPLQRACSNLQDSSSQLQDKANNVLLCFQTEYLPYCEALLIEKGG